MHFRNKTICITEKIQFKGFRSLKKKSYKRKKVVMVEHFPACFYLKSYHPFIVLIDVLWDISKFYALRTKEAKISLD